MHILVCDDDAAFAAQMDEYISEWFRAREIQVQSTVCTSGEQLLATPELERYQLAFLDVDLKTTDGIALGRKLRQVAPDIVLVYISAYLEFAPQGRSTSTAISRTSPSAPFTARSLICPPCCTKTAFCR